ncbi:hypothetical protein B5F29_11840 [Lachnoclostridium sp. An196]|uniref:GNAT family N-acetyltransferase n=1 Tax=Lachnoclostridium sp. An196 TaxID=1965583 RepID=UPI000B3A1259|nr:GNAT family protein [Lachnoclostridium sp. An196]OUP18046.1 hypothetical protein B5F29_11840 [Lachnoclostridium sp. An196]
MSVKRELYHRRQYELYNPSVASRRRRSAGRAFKQPKIHFRTAEIGYYIGENFWGHGIATHAVKQACGDIFARTDILRIFAEPFSYNAASCRVLEKAGFQFEGLLRNNAVKNGKILDMKMYARLR